MTFSICGNGQTRNAWLNAGVKSLNGNDFISASYYLERAFLMDSTDVSTALLYGKALEGMRDYDRSLSLYGWLSTNDAIWQYPQFVFEFGMNLKRIGEYEQAGLAFGFCYGMMKSDTAYFARRSLHEISACKEARELINNPLQTVPENMGKKVNSPFSEGGARTDLSGNLFYYSNKFIKKNKKNKPVYQSRLLKLEPNSSRPKELESSINENGYDLGSVSLNKAGNILYFSKCENLENGERICTIWKSKLENKKWSNSVLLDERINYPGSSTGFPHIVDSENNHDILFFSSNRSGGFGKWDVWFSEIDSSGNFSDAKNAGSMINTEENEISPATDDSLHIIYFSSDGHKSLGGLDIFYSRKKDSTWTQPVNIGYPINSSADEHSFFRESTEDHVTYLASNRTGSQSYEGSTCCFDLYKFELYELRDKPEMIQLPLVRMREILPFDLFFHNDEPDARSTKTETKKEYDQVYREYIKLYSQYLKGFTANMSIPMKDSARKEVDSFFTDHLKKGKKELDDFLDILTEALEDGDSFEVTLMGFTSPLAKDDYNLKLASRRISSVEKYIGKYNNGALKNYLNPSDNSTPRLILKREALGESLASTEVSDDPHNLRESIYSPKASKERRIRVVGINPISIPD